MSQETPSKVQQLPRVAVVILNYNGKLLSEQCLCSIMQSSYLNKEVILVDNASTDGSVEHIRKLFPDVQILANSENLGCAGGRNIAYREAFQKGYDYILSLDNDTRIKSSMIEELVAVGESDPWIGVLGPKVYADDGSQTIQCAGGRITYTQNVCSERGAGEIDRGQYDHIEDVDYVSGSGGMIRCEVFEQATFLDENFYLYAHEDTDFCMRVRQAGYRIVYVPEAVMWHKGGATIGSYSPRKKYVEAVNSAYFVRKYGTSTQQVKYIFFAGFGLIYALLVQSLRGNHQAVFAKARGLWDGLLKPMS
jgi:GT2 family glycosyltransferase